MFSNDKPSNWNISPLVAKWQNMYWQSEKKDYKTTLQ